ncbi:sodium/hydrogen exchanger 10 isoform X2 [Nematostella vectensis]|uniref:sodium/hydrogen exchanger 10 isoform X2 n=1 Tax=Nematostella vectensis TaxID=45351 RepID=UPI0020776C44|nr:sodium/hydrogen exchanger 10 isoform X2 [Nematostella vectensis]
MAHSVHCGSHRSWVLFRSNIRDISRTSKVLLLALVGLAISAAMSGVMGKMIFTYNWTWLNAFMFGAIISATDPVAVVALLNDLGTSKQLATIIEGESLLNDGMAIVMYKIFYNLSFSSLTPTEIGLYFPRVAVGGYFFGLAAGKITVFWLQRVFNDAMVEITITLVSTYLTFYIGEEVLGISGVIAVVILGIEVNAQKTSISPEVEVFLHRFWEMLAYLANTLIFIMAGVVIVEQTLHSFEPFDAFLLVVDYLGITVIRALVISSLSPILMHIGYGFTWQTAVVVCWGGLRGAVGLALALQVYIDHEAVGHKILVHTAGICILTLCVNATTMKKLLEKMGMSDISDSRIIAMTNGVKRIKESNNSTLTMLKADRFLADADWSLAEKYCDIHNPYVDYDSEGEVDSETPTLIRHSTCPNCEASVPNEPSPKEFAEMADDGRVRMIKAQKVSFWKQFEHGMLSREAVQALTHLADEASDEANKIIEAEDLTAYWRIPPYLQKVRDKLESIRHLKASDAIPPPKTPVQLFMYKVAAHVMFDATMNGLILLNVIPIIFELEADDNASYLPTLKIINYLYVTLYTMETIWKIVAFRIYYFKAYWNLLDLFIVALSFIDIIIDQAASSSDDTSFSSTFLKTARIFRVLRMGRLLRLIKSVVPKIIDFVNNIVNRKLSFGYDVGKGYIVAEEEVNKLIDHMVVDKRISRDLKSRSDQNRLEVVKSLGMLQREHPGIAISVKTRQATRTVLNNARDVINELRGGGLLDEAESHKLESIIETKMKRQLNAPAYIPPQSPESLLRNVVWLDNMEPEVIDDITSIAEMRVFDFGHTIAKQGEEVDGIYLIVSGMVKMIGVSVAKWNKPSDGQVGDMIVSTDYMSAGNLIGEFGLLTGSTRNSSCTCETSVQAYFMPKDKLLKIMETHSDLHDRLWRVCGVRIAVPLLLDMLVYHNWTKDKIRLMCERSYLAKLPGPGINSMFRISSMMQEVLLIQGRATCTSTNEAHIGPCILPKMYKTFRLHYDKEPKILVIVRVNENPVSEDIGDTPSALDLLGITHSMTRGRSSSFTGRRASFGQIDDEGHFRQRRLSGIYDGGRRLEPLPESYDRNVTKVLAISDSEEVIHHDKIL